MDVNESNRRSPDNSNGTPAEDRVKLLEIIDQTQLRISLRSSSACTTIMTKISIARSKLVTPFTTERNGTLGALSA